MPSRLPIDRAALAEFCRKWHIRRLALFGSVLRDDFGPESDVDFLYEFEEGHVPAWEIVTIKSELSDLVGREVDFVSFKYISKYMRERVLAEAEDIYESKAQAAA